MDISTAIKKRRSIREYKKRKVPKRLLNRILESARWAPSLHNMQPWEFIILAKKMQKKLVGVLKKAQNKEPFLIRLTLKNSINVIEKAPVVILAYSNGVLSNKVKKGGRLYSDYLNAAATFEAQSVACAIQNMLLTAHSVGLGSTWFGIPIFSEKAVNRLFGLDYKLMAILTFGYPKNTPEPPRRRPLKEIVSLRK